MAFVPARCTQCGGDIEVDNTKEAGICKHCGTAFVTEKAIMNYNTYITNHNSFVGANVTMNVSSELEQLVSAAEGFSKLGEYDNAFKTYESIIEKYPQDVRGWLGCLYTFEDGEFLKNSPELLSDDWLNKEPASRWINNAYRLADDITKNTLTKNKETYIEAISEKWNKYMSALSYSNLKKFIGEDVYYASPERYSRVSNIIFVHEDKLYYQVSQQKTSSVDYIYITFEITDVGKDGNVTMHCLNSDWDYSGDYRGWFSYTQNRAIKIYYFGNYHNNGQCIALNLDNNIVWLTKSNIIKSRLTEQIKPEGKYCYIATYIYDSYDCPQVWVLRRFRDYILDTTWYGKIFIKCYYAISPILIKFFGRFKWFKAFCKSRLDKMVLSLKNKGINDTQYFDKY